MFLSLQPLMTVSVCSVNLFPHPFFLAIPVARRGTRAIFQMSDKRNKAPPVKIVIDPPDTPGNFVGYNVLCSSLDNDRLMQPIYEAEYDSETQACVDIRSGEHASYYEHYAPQARRKKGLHIGPESPLPRPALDLDLLAPPRATGLPLAPVPSSVLQDPVARRLATGVWPRK
ncbi:uncharacterized protein Tco025E_06765 [Trypanosoma conorhini]|uniref:Uncharacterized protein n=1 Tax=Trypanosoma conorhini TaxID=83891 RepID=A0A422NYV2_9TRYP|nr:uncharacterized protein Tco025E_06765 [Trypanosoma conorhini]RNF10657.1 hypothetical protein Tco025E_06765 [Trypanosoma conorhini]